MRAFLIIAVILISVIGAVAQTNKGAISGAVVDPNGAAVPGATVTVTNLGTGQKVTVTTSDTGSFNIQSLDPVVYRVLVEAKGFKKAVLDKVKVDTAVTVPANITLETGSISEQVVVTAEAAMINTESGTRPTYSHSAWVRTSISRAAGICCMSARASDGSNAPA